MSALEVWNDDHLLSAALRKFAQVRPVQSLERPVAIASGPLGETLSFDYNFFALLRSLCRAFVGGQALDGAVLSLHTFQVGCGLNAIGMTFEAGTLLRKACALRSRHTVRRDIPINEAALYQRAVNFCMLHEHAHLHFDRDPKVAQDWLMQARGRLLYLSRQGDNEAFNPDTVLRVNLAQEAERFLGNDLLAEEVASDLYAANSAVRHEVKHLALTIAGSVDRQSNAARLAIIAVYTARIIAESSRLAVEAISGMGPDEDAPSALLEAETFLSAVRLRSSVVMLDLAVLRSDLENPGQTVGSVNARTLVPPHDAAFNLISASLQGELVQCEERAELYETITVGRIASAGEGEQAAIAAMIDAYRKNFWMAGLFT